MLFRSDITVHYREKRGKHEVFVCTFAQDAGVVIPAWMFDAAYCATLTLGDRRSSILALKELRELLDEMRAEPPTATPGIVAAEGSDVTPKSEEKNHASRLSNSNRISDEERTSQRKRTLKSSRVAEPSHSSSRKRAQGQRGTR